MSRQRLSGLWNHAACGFILGVLGELTARELNLPDAIQLFRLSDIDLVAAGVLGALLAVTRLRWALWAWGGFLCAALLVIGYTPLVEGPARALIDKDTPRSCEAVVVLSSGIYRDGTLVAVAQDRLMRGLELLHQGTARRLVVTRLPRGWASSVPTVRRQMTALGISAPIDEVGPANNTYDEAVAVSQLARERGWKEILLVTSPLHTRRARATFLKAGLSVCVQPCPERRYDLSALGAPRYRVRAFQDWLYETAGWYTYHLRGRL